MLIRQSGDACTTDADGVPAPARGPGATGNLRASPDTVGRSNPERGHHVRLASPSRHHKPHPLGAPRALNLTRLATGTGVMLAGAPAASAVTVPMASPTGSPPPGP